MAVVNRAIARYRVGMKTNPNAAAMDNSNPPPAPTALASEAWAAWQERLAKSNLTSEQKEQATAVLIKLMKLREAHRPRAIPARPGG